MQRQSSEIRSHLTHPSLLEDIKDGEVYSDHEGHIWYRSPRGNVELLATPDEVCGVGRFSSPIDDPFRPACIVHDRMYVNRKFFESRGWNRKLIDDHFLKLSLDIAYKLPLRFLESNLKMAQTRYRAVRLFGWIVYYRN